MAEILLIRHGETEWNVIGRYQGQADPPLNDRGIEQAHTLAQELKAEGIELLVSSPLKRAAQTAEILATALAIPLEYEPRLVEIHQGDWQTRLRSEIEAMYPTLFKQWETQPWEVTPPGGEDLRTVQKRVYAALEEIVCNHPNKKIGIVAHRIPIALIKHKYQGMEADIVRTLDLPNTYWESITISCQKED